MKTTDLIESELMGFFMFDIIDIFVTFVTLSGCVNPDSFRASWNNAEFLGDDDA